MPKETNPRAKGMPVMYLYSRKSKNSAHIQKLLADIQNKTAKFTKKSGVLNVLYEIKIAMSTVGMIMETPSSLTSITQQVSLISQNKIWKLSVTRGFLNFSKENFISIKPFVLLRVKYNN